MSDLNSISQPFAPVNGPTASTVAIAVTASSQRVALPAAASGEAIDIPINFVVDNQGTTVWAFVAFGGAAVTATISAGATPGSYPCPPGVKTRVTVYGNPSNVAIIGSAAGPTNVYVTPGSGR